MEFNATTDALCGLPFAGCVTSVRSQNYFVNEEHFQVLPASEFFMSIEHLQFQFRYIQQLGKSS